MSKTEWNYYEDLIEEIHKKCYNKRKEQSRKAKEKGKCKHKPNKNKHSYKKHIK